VSFAPLSWFAARLFEFCIALTLLALLLWSEIISLSLNVCNLNNNVFVNIKWCINAFNAYLITYNSTCPIIVGHAQLGHLRCRPSITDRRVASWVYNGCYSSDRQYNSPICVLISSRALWLHPPDTMLGKDAWVVRLDDSTK